MVKGFVLGFDFGTKRIGVAVGQCLTKTASHLPVLLCKAGIPDWKSIEYLIKEWQPNALVVGIPLNMDGTEQWITYAAKAFATELEKRFFLPVYGIDERLTTVEAKARIYASGGGKALRKQRSQIDSRAAQLILIDWLTGVGKY